MAGKPGEPVRGLILDGRWASPAAGAAHRPSGLCSARHGWSGIDWTSTWAPALGSKTWISAKRLPAGRRKPLDRQRPGSLDEVHVVDPDFGLQGRACLRRDVPLGLPVDAVDLGGDPLRLLVAPLRVDGDAASGGNAATAGRLCLLILPGARGAGEDGFALNYWMLML